MALSSKPFVSIATPVHNGEKYLPECIESVLAQTYENWEYLIVNNCSTDRSLEIATYYAEKDSRIRINNTKTLLAPLQNHNHMLRQITPTSKYCKILHADDWLFPDCITQMVHAAEVNPSVGIVGSYRLANNKVKSYGLPYTQTVIPRHVMARMNLLEGPYTFGTPSALLIRSALIRARKAFYDESRPSADTEVCYDLLKNCDFGFVHQLLTYSRIHTESIASFNNNLNKQTPNSIYIFKKYGPIYLSKEEYDKGLKNRIRIYYEFLGSNIFDSREKNFWRYHKNELNQLGLSSSWSRILLAASLLLMKNIVDTKHHIKRILNLMSKFNRFFLTLFILYLN